MGLAVGASHQLPFPALSVPPQDTCDLATANEDYAARFAGPAGAHLLNVQHRATQHMLKPFGQGSVLDLGGAHGQNATLLTQWGHKTTVYGSHPDCDFHLRPLIDQDAIHFDVGDLYQLPYADREHDVVLSYRMMAHIQDPDAYIAQMCRVANKAVIIDFASSRSINAISPLLFAHKQKLEKNTRPFNLFRPRDLQRRFAQHGFKRTATIGQFLWPMVMHRALHHPTISRVAEAIPHALGLAHFLGSPVIARYERISE